MTQKSDRLLGRSLARELTVDEIGSVAGGTVKEIKVPTNVGPRGDTATEFDYD